MEQIIKEIRDSQNIMAQWAQGKNERSIAIEKFNELIKKYPERYEKLMDLNLRRIIANTKINNATKCVLLFGNYSQYDPMMEKLCTNSNVDYFYHYEAIKHYNYYCKDELDCDKMRIGQILTYDDFKTIMECGEKYIYSYFKLILPFVVDVELVKKILDKNNISYTCTPYYKQYYYLWFVPYRSKTIDGYIINIDLSTTKDE
uniref:Uncharacterized protein n=1 Tax=viral metagenome TaxID=1070528 RepID=A0A6C0EBH6_9ZZZZ